MGHGQMPVFIAMGLVFMLVSMSFKVSAAPFHFWTPDVYDGAPTVFTSFMSTVVKAAGFFAFLRLFEKAFGSMQDQWQNMIAWITFATLLIGNITAVFQHSVKRMLAYSSIAQAGFMMLAVFAMNGKAKEGILLYSAAYSLATIGIFGVLTKMEDYTISGFNGLSKSNPVVALTATIFLLSLTGVPLTAGFQSKFFLLISAVENGNHIWLVVTAVLFAAISAYYYFRVIQAMYFKTAESDDQMVMQPITTQYTFILVLIAVLILIIGIYPELIIGWMYR
jgi:NADH-quinone oxidoreductase subunit N